MLEEHCTIHLHEGAAVLESRPDAQCWVNSQFVDKPSRLTQGMFICLCACVFIFFALHVHVCAFICIHFIIIC